ncbi:MAG TPA: SH3 domain-containing protein [Candidatus Dormibacteraeota bacterium]|nr:SH3 domain-containing protein [Candidatus Dormibacteraeota bacterium]
MAPWQSLRGPVLAFVQGGGDASGAGSGPDGLAGSSGGDLAGVAPGAALTSPFFDDWRSAGSNVLDASTGTRGGGLGAGSGTAALAATIPGLGHGIPLEQLLTTAVVTAGGVAMAMSFMLFGRRRRDDEPTGTDEALAASAAAGAGLVATGALLGGAVPAVAPARDAELDLPRWRRPSLLAARKEDPLRVARTDPRLTFDHGLVAPIEGVERRVIRYRLVRLLDSPDELVAAELGVLDEGDEVQLLKRSGPYWLVLSPDGRQGWIHRMVLGDVVRDDDTGLEVSLTPAAPAERRDAVVGPGGGMRLASEGGAAWSLQGAVATDAGMDIDDDVLRAYLESRRKV